MDSINNAVFDLTTSEGVKTYLLQTPFSAINVAPLTGGVGNFTYRVTLEKPFQSHHTVGQALISHLVLKHAEPYVATNRDFPLDVGRQEFEILACREVPKIMSLMPNVSLPTIYYEDTSNKVVLLQDCGETSMTLKDYLKFRSPPIELAGRIGSSLGQFLGELHLLSHQSQSAVSPGVVLKERLSKNVQARHISAYITYGVVKNNLSSAVTPHVHQSEIITLIDSMQDKIKNTNECLVMGDFWPGNILVYGDSMDQLMIIDWELAKPGLPGLDVGQFLAEVYTLSKFHPSSQSAVERLTVEFIRSYRSVLLSSSSFNIDEIEQVATTHVGAHLIAITPIARPKWGSDEMIREIISEGYTFILNSGNENWRRECLFKAFR